MKAIHLHQEAQSEIEQAVVWYEQQAPGVGSELREELARAYQAIGEAPERWVAWPGLEAEPRVRRYLLRKFPYTIVYVAIGDAVLVLAAAHQNRRPLYWTKRLPR